MKIAPPRIRILLVGLTLLVAIQAFLAFGFYRAAISDGKGGFRFPLPSRIAAMVASYEAAEPARRDTLLAALSSEDVTVMRVATGDLNVSEERNAQLPGVESIIDEYVDALGSRNVRAWLAPIEGEELTAPRMERLRLWSRHPMRLAVSLEDGDWLMVENRGDHAGAIYGTPPGFWSGALGVIVASLSLITLWRGLAPLEALANSVNAFAAQHIPDPTRPRGPRETRRIIEAVNQMQLDISEDISDRRIMFSALSHDLRTYLTRLKLRIQKIPDREVSERANNDVNVMSTIIEDALLLAKLDADAGDTLQRIPTKELIEEITKRNDFSEDQLTLTQDAAEAHIEANPVSVLRAVQNIIDNAQKYADGCRLDVSTASTDLHIDITDRGPGIPDEDLNRLIRPFERGDDARSQEKPGTGLGLAISARIVEKAGGKLTLENLNTGGLCVRIKLPVVSAD